ncbi:MAG: hypothetical protein JWL95_470 [Gemmatimonadetes bacterium]|nr:hypothetical protein [Gemmatimonadota bacterium]
MRTVSGAVLTLVLAVATVGAPSASIAQAVAHPSFAGSWLLDSAQSDHAQMAPTKLSLAVTQSPTELVVVRAQTTQMGESNATLKYALDGSTSVNELPMGGNTLKISTVITWEGPTPVFTNSLTVNGTDVQQVDRWTLADGGKKLIIARVFNLGGETTSFKLVLLKQP